MSDGDFEAFARRAQVSMLSTAVLLAGDVDLGRDLLQEALVKTMLRWRIVAEPEAYVRRVLVTTAIDWRRRRRLSEVPLGSHDGPVTDVVDVGGREWALRLVRSLPPAQRAVVVLRYFDDLSERQTAELLGISVGAVKSQGSRALAALRARAERTEVEHDR